jgi:hypothetical protein
MTARLTIAVLVCLAAAAAAQVPPGQDAAAQLVDNRNAAAGFVGTLKFAVGRGAKTCGEVLNKDDAFVHEIVDDWLSRNQKYSAASERWISLIVSSVANQKGMPQGLALKDQIMKSVAGNAQDAVDTLLGKTDAERAKSCPLFASKIHSGVWDVTPAARRYSDIEELATAMGDAAH